MAAEIRAINGDNKSEVLSLVSLFTRCLGDHFEITGIYDPRFLKACLSSRFISLVATYEGRCIAHLAFAQRAKGNIQIVLPLIDPDFLDIKHDIEEAFCAVLATEKSRKSWKNIELAPLDSKYILDLTKIGATQRKLAKRTNTRQISQSQISLSQ